MISFLIYALIAVFWAENVLKFSLTNVKGLSLLNLVVYFMIVVWAAKYTIRKKLFLPNNLNKYVILLILLGVFAAFNKIWSGELSNEGLFGELIISKNYADPIIVFPDTFQSDR